MPASGGRAAHKLKSSPSSSSSSSSPSPSPSCPSWNAADSGKKMLSISMQPPRRDNTAGRAPRRPNRKMRAYSASAVPKADADGADDLDREEITDDSFFQRFHFPHVEAAKDKTSEYSLDSSSDSEGPLSPTHNKYRLPTAEVSSDSSSGSALHDPSPAMQAVNIAVVGASGVGKSTFIRRALGLPDSTPPNHCCRKWTVDGTVYMVRFLELLLQDVHIGDRSFVKWPETIHGVPIAQIHGVITMYDVTAQRSLLHVPEMLNVLAKAHTPLILVASKCDQHLAGREVDPATVEQKAKSFVGDISIFQISESIPETHQKCVAVIVKAAIATTRSKSQASATAAAAAAARKRANSSVIKPISQKGLWNQKHKRASSEISARFSKGSNEFKGHRYQYSDANKTFFNAEESPGYDSQASDDQDSDAAQSVSSVKPSDETGYTFDQLVDRLLAQPMSKNDTKFISVFLALYRKFATPGQLFEAILERFHALDKETELPMLTMIAQLRHLAILQQWVAYYPGDFAYPTTQKLLSNFADAQMLNREYAAAAAEIRRDLDAVTEDDDTDWACSDRQRAQSMSLFHNNVLDDNCDDYLTRMLHMSMGSDRLSDPRSSTMTGGTQSTLDSTGPTHTLFTQIEQNERLAQQLEPNPIMPLSKMQWHQFMSETDETIAKELTRIDWIMFSSVRPRDLVRHVSLNVEEKKRCKNLENVSRMTDHFNHIAYLVSNYILMRDKPKHRALMLEKWMKVARQLRKLNNYNSLGAVLAGIKGTSVYRLVATRDLVPQQTTHDFLKLDILMGPQKSHFAYRLAWDNSSGERIPYIPLHRRDLVSASEGNSTLISAKKKTDSAVAPHPGVSVFDGTAGKRDTKEPPLSGVDGKDRINWRKFDIMGEVIVGVQRAQGTPYPNWPKCKEVRNLILDIKIKKDDDDLYDRSIQLEAPAASEKGRFAKWFRER